MIILVPNEKDALMDRLEAAIKSEHDKYSATKNGRQLIIINARSREIFGLWKALHFGNPLLFISVANR